MKKLFSVLVVGLLLLVYACGGGDDPKSVLNDVIDTLDNMMNDLEKADSADAIVAAFEKGTEAMKKLRPRMKAVEEKYPELKDLKPGTKFPEGFEDIEKRWNELFAKMMGMGAKMGKYLSDPKVQEASKKFNEIMK